MMMNHDRDKLIRHRIAGHPNAYFCWASKTYRKNISGWISDASMMMSHGRDKLIRHRIAGDSTAYFSWASKTYLKKDLGIGYN